MYRWLKVCFIYFNWFEFCLKFVINLFWTNKINHRYMSLMKIIKFINSNLLFRLGRFLLSVQLDCMITFDRPYGVYFTLCSMDGFYKQSLWFFIYYNLINKVEIFNLIKPSMQIWKHFDEILILINIIYDL